MTQKGSIRKFFGSSRGGGGPEGSQRGTLKRGRDEAALSGDSAGDQGAQSLQPSAAVKSSYYPAGSDKESPARQVVDMSAFASKKKFSRVDRAVVARPRAEVGQVQVQQEEEQEDQDVQPPSIKHRHAVVTVVDDDEDTDDQVRIIMPSPQKVPSPPEVSVPPVTVSTTHTQKHLPSPPKKASKGFHKFVNRSGPSAPGSKPLPVGRDNCLAGSTFVFTGELESTSREAAADLVKRYGGRVTSAVSGKTSYLVVGAEPGESKMKKARDVHVEILDEDGLFELVKTAPAKAPSMSIVSAVSPAQSTTKKSKNTAATVAGSAASPLSSIDSKGRSTQQSTLSANNSSLWTVKWAPTTVKEIIGNKGHVEALEKWLSAWHGRGDKSGSKMNAALISGPPGIGKTTAAHLVAKKCGFDIMEMNASDVRNKSSIDNVVKDLISNHSLTEYFSAKKTVTSAVSGRSTNHCVIMDEVDGMGGGDRGGMAELIQLIKKTKIPIICICNDRSSPKVRSLANYCLDLRFSRPTAMQIRSRMMSIACKEGIRVDANAIDQLAAATHADIRQVLNLLQTWKLKNIPMTYDGSKQLTESSRKNPELGIFDLASKMLFARDMSMEDKISELYFADYSLLPPFIQENYIRIRPNPKPADSALSGRMLECRLLEYVSAASDAVSNGDLVDSMIFGRQLFNLMPTHAVFSCILPAYYVQGSMTERMSFPNVLGQTSKTNKGWRLLKELHLHMRLHISADKDEVRQSYLPALVPRLTQPLITEGADAVADIIELMHAYTITKDDWDAALELGVANMTGDSLLKKIQSSVKSTLTRLYNKSSHLNPFATGSTGGKKTATSSIASVKVDLEDAVDTDDMNDVIPEGPDDEDTAEDKMVKVKPSTAATKTKKTAAASKRGKKK